MSKPLAIVAALGAFLSFSFVFFASRVAAAETIAAPVGGRAVPLGPERVACRDSLANAPWTAEPDGHAVKPPARADAIGQITTVRVAANEAACAATTPATPGASTTTTTAIALVAVGPKPVVDPASVVVEADAGRVTLRGHQLRGAVLAWRAAGKQGTDTCTTPDTSQPAWESCVFAVPRDLPADATALDLEVLPAGLAGGRADDVALFDAAARRTPPAEYEVRPAQIVLTRLVPADTTVDVSSGVARVPLVHPESVAAVDCTDATCDVAGGDLVVRGEHGPDAKLDVHVQLRPRVALRAGTTLDPAPVLAIPIQRCPVSLASAPPVAGAAEQSVVLRLGASCARGDGELEYATALGPAPVERSEVIAGDRYVVVRAGHVDAGTTLRVLRRGTVVGVVPLVPRHPEVVRARLELPPYGPIDFIPTNRWAKIVLPPSPLAGELVPAPAEGAYEIRHDADGYWIRGAKGASGAAFLRFAYVDAALPGPLRGTALAELVEPVDRALRVANVPVPLGEVAHAKAPLVELRCGDGAGHALTIAPEAPSYIPYAARDTCRVLVHRERLREEDGAQAFQIAIQVTSSDGLPRGEARVDKKLVLHRADAPAVLAVSGATAPFDRILVRAGIADDETHYAVSVPEKGATQAQWSVVTGTSHVRLYGTAAIPTGLFRVADTGHSGILTLSVGALLRAVLLSREGTEFPVGLEAGIMWLGVAGDTDPSASSRGAVALVAGPGISVPIANVSRVTQTSIALHAWFEYEASREILGQSGQAFGFVFGPSISIGDIGTNL